MSGDDILGRLDELIAPRPRAERHGDRPAAVRHPRPGPVGQRLPRHGADRRGAPRQAPTSWSPVGSPTPASRSARSSTSSAGRPDDWDKVAAGTVAGHIIECGAQSSGGNLLKDWRGGEGAGRSRDSRSSRRRPTAASSSPSTPAPAAWSRWRRSPSSWSTRWATRGATSRPTASPTSPPSSCGRRAGTGCA